MVGDNGVLLPRVVFFAKTVIRVGEELTIDYEGVANIDFDDMLDEQRVMQWLPDILSRKIRCLCGAVNCRKWIPM